VAFNTMGRSLEEGRRQDISFLLERFRLNRDLPESALRDADKSSVFLAGYGAGGAALLMLTGSAGFAARYPSVKGVIAVESPLLSVLEGEKFVLPPLPSDNWFISLWSGIRGRVAERQPRKITGIGAVPNPGVPVCFLLSDRVVNPRHREDRYATILRVFQDAGMPAVIAAAKGAGPLDYSDIPEKYPLYPVLMSGAKKSLLRAAHGRRETAALMTEFAAALLEEASRGGVSLARSPLSAQGFHVERNKSWNSLKSRFIL
jgi:hypothetical protein